MGNHWAVQYHRHLYRTPLGEDGILEVSGDRSGWTKAHRAAVFICFSLLSISSSCHFSSILFFSELQYCAKLLGHQRMLFLWLFIWSIRVKLLGEAVQLELIHVGLSQLYD